MDELSETTIRRWAYEPDLQLDDDNPDEDLLLHDPRYVALLLTLADDAACPTRTDIIRILDHYMMNLVLRGDGKDLRVVSEAIAFAGRAKTEDLRQWADAQRRRVAYRGGVGPLDKQGALIAADELLIGLCRKAAALTFNGEANGAWQIDLTVPPSERAIERLLIDQGTGRFRYLANHAGLGWQDYGPRDTV